VDRLRKELGISDYDAMGTAPTPSLDADIVRRLQSDALSFETQLAAQIVQLTNFSKLSPEQRRDAVQIAIGPDTELGALLAEHNLAQSKLVGLQQEYQPDHPSYISAKKLMEDAAQKIDRRVEGILIGLTNRVDVLRAQCNAINTKLNEARTNDIAKAEISRPYYVAKAKLEHLLRFESALAMKLSAETIDSRLPRSMLVEILDNAVAGTRPVRPNKPLNIVLGIAIGLIVGVGLAFFIEYLDTSVKTIDDVERTLQSPVLGVIPQNVGLLFEEGAESPHAEAYRVLRTNLLFSRKDDKLNTVAVVSAGAGEGKSTTVMNLATVFAQGGHRVLVVDSDLRRPTLHKMLRVANSIGLTNYLLKQNTLEEVIQTTGQPTLDFMASGKLPSSSLGILSSAQMKDLITELKQRYDFVFFDSPPIMGVSDASILASEVDIALQVIQYRRYPQPMNIRAKQLIEKVGGNLVGIVLNNINMSQDESYYYYSGYYHDYYSKNEEMSETSPADGQDKKGIKQKY
jgi:capsular exopolysaccharide synthesis family protein